MWGFQEKQDKSIHKNREVWQEGEVLFSYGIAIQPQQDPVLSQ